MQQTGLQNQTIYGSAGLSAIGYPVRVMVKPPTPSTSASSGPSLRDRLGAFLVERHPFVAETVLRCLGDPLNDPAVDMAALRKTVATTFVETFSAVLPATVPDPAPGVTGAVRLGQEIERLIDDVDGFFHREQIGSSLRDEERLELLRGMLLTRAIDIQLKNFYLGGHVRYRGLPFQGKGFRSLGQEAIYGAPLRMRRGDDWSAEDGSWRGDVVAPLIRDLGAALAMDSSPSAVQQVLAAQMGKAGSPMEGRDLHIGNFRRGVLPATAPLSISTLTVSGLAMAFSQEASERVAVSFIGEGGSSLGEWHEAINLCAARKLPAIFCIQNNQTALATPVPEQTAVRTFADKAAGYGLPGVTIDGTDPEAVAAAFALGGRSRTPTARVRR